MTMTTTMTVDTHGPRHQLPTTTTPTTAAAVPPTSPPSLPSLVTDGCCSCQHNDNVANVNENDTVTSSAGPVVNETSVQGAQ